MAKRRTATTFHQDNDDDEEEAPRGKRKMDPIIQGLFDRLPASGHEWPDQDRTAWLDMLRQAFNVIYKREQVGGHVVKPGDDE